MRGLPHFHPLPVGSRRKGRFWEYACSSLCCKYNWMRMRGCRLFPLTFTRRHTPSWHPQFRLVLHSKSHRHQLQWVGQRKNRIVHAETIIASKRLPIYSKEHKWIVPPLSSRWFYLSLSPSTFDLENQQINYGFQINYVAQGSGKIKVVEENER